MKTKSEHFVADNKNDWVELKDIVAKISKKGIKSLTTEQLEFFPGLYRKVCQDLAQARMLKLSPDVLEYLNSLTAISHQHLYYLKPVTLKEIATFFVNKLPKTILKNYIYILISAVLFIGSGTYTYFNVLKNPEFAYTVIDQDTLTYIGEMHSEVHNDGREKEVNTYMAAFYIQHNISIAFLSFATGIFLGIGSIYFLLFNGVYMGCLFGYLYNVGYGQNILHFITGHAFLELTGLIVAGAAGILLGVYVLEVWKSYSVDILRENKNRILILVSSAFFMIGTAAFIEGYISPSALPYWSKVLVLGITVSLSIFYYIVYPLIIKRSNK